MTTLKFKSTPDNYAKEITGVKSNTVRKDDTDERFVILENWESGDPLKIKIENTETKGSFVRKVTDVTYFDGYYIISWGVEE